MSFAARPEGSDWRAVTQMSTSFLAFAGGSVGPRSAFVVVLSPCRPGSLGFVGAGHVRPPLWDRAADSHWLAVVQLRVKEARGGSSLARRGLP